MSSSGRNDVTSRPAVGTVQRMAITRAPIEAQRLLSSLRLVSAAASSFSSGASMTVISGVPSKLWPERAQRVEGRASWGGSSGHLPHLSDVVDDDGQDEHEDQDRERGAEAPVGGAEALHVELVGQHAGLEVATGDGADDVEDLERGDRDRREDHDQRRADARDGDVAEHLEAAHAVE